MLDAGASQRWWCVALHLNGGDAGIIAEMQCVFVHNTYTTRETNPARVYYTYDTRATQTARAHVYTHTGTSYIYTRRAKQTQPSKQEASQPAKQPASQASKQPSKQPSGRAAKQPAVAT